MSEEKPGEGNLTEEFRKLGKNLVDAARAAWDNPERQRLQGEIERGLTEMRDSMRKEYEYWRESPTGQKVRQDVSNIGEKIRESDIENKVRGEMISTLHQLNEELQNIANRWSTTQESDSDHPQRGEAAGPAESDQEGHHD